MSTAKESKMLKSVTDDLFHVLVRERDEPTVVLFTGSWCQPCKKFLPVVEKMADRTGSYIQFLLADLDQTMESAQDLGIRSVPSLVLFEGGMVQSTHSGSMSSEELRLWITENIS